MLQKQSIDSDYIERADIHVIFKKNVKQQKKNEKIRMTLIQQGTLEKRETFKWP